MTSCAQIVWLFWQPAVSLSVGCGRAGEPEVNLLLNVKSEDVNFFMVILCLVKQSLVGTVSQARLLTISAKSGTYCSLFWLRTHLGEDRLTDNIHNNKPKPVFALDIQGFVSEIDHTTIIVGCEAKWSIQVLLQQSLQELRQKKKTLKKTVCKTSQNALQ